MHSRINRPAMTFGVFMISGILAIITIFLVISGISHAGVQPGTHKGRLITIHDRGTDKVILSQAETIGDAINEAGISVDSHDAVEPVVTKKLVASEYQVNIYRARSVIVVDGNIRQKIVTAAQTADQLVQTVGINLYPEDQTVFAQADNIADGASMQLNIKRATPFEFTLYGRANTARTQALTVGDMLSEKGIKLTSDDRVTPGQDTKIGDGIKVKLWREGKQTITVDEPVSFDIQQTKDADREVGYKHIQVPGVAGSRNVTYEIIIRDGQEVGRREIASLVTKQPKKQVEVIGIKLKVGTPNENRKYARAIMGDYGFGADQWVCLDSLWTHESGWDQYKSNYAGSGAYGIPQALPGSKMGAGWQSDPAVQINWGLNYIKNRYSNPCGAYNHWRSNNWY